MNYPTISVIIPRKSDDSAEKAIEAILHAEYPQQFIEIIEVLGENPSKQRNTGAGVAHGDILYFLDNDSMITPTLFLRVARYYTDTTLMTDAETLAGIGGPNITPETDGFLQKLSGYALASPFAHFNMSARYTPTGNVRLAGEKELILCNFSIRKDIFLHEQGFNESLYPNEENEFINRLISKGYRFLYVPDATVSRSRRKRFGGFIKQLFRYGRGRAEQMSVEGLSLKSLLFFLPLGLLGYLILLFGLMSVGRVSWWCFLPLVVYGFPAILSAFLPAFRERNPLFALLLPFWYLVMHLSYAAGLLFGFGKGIIPQMKKNPVQPSSPVDIIFRKTLGAEK